MSLDSKKNDNAEMRNEIAKDISSIRNLKQISQEKKQELIEDLLSKKELTQTPVEKANPFPEHKGYTELWKSLSPDQQKEMKENIRITTDGKIEIIKMKKKFSLLTAQHDGNNVFDWSYVDQYGNTGAKGISYLTYKGAKKAMKEQGKKLFQYKSELEKFINIFPGKDVAEKISNFLKLFDLEKKGAWDDDKKVWRGEPYKPITNSDVNMTLEHEDGYIYGISDKQIFWSLKRDHKPYLAFEDC